VGDTREALSSDGDLFVLWDQSMADKHGQHSTLAALDYSWALHDHRVRQQTVEQLHREAAAALVFVHGVVAELLDEAREHYGPAHLCVRAVTEMRQCLACYKDKWYGAARANDANVFWSGRISHELYKNRATEAAMSADPIPEGWGPVREACQKGDLFTLCRRRSGCTGAVTSLDLVEPVLWLTLQFVPHIRSIAADLRTVRFPNYRANGSVYDHVDRDTYTLIVHLIAPLRHLPPRAIVCTEQTAATLDEVETFLCAPPGSTAPLARPPRLWQGRPVFNLETFRRAMRCRG
jgi:hypothetical protein